MGVKPPQEAVPYLNLLIYGEPGAGKTFLAATAEDSEDTSPILFLDVEGGAVTIRHRHSVDVLEVRSIDDVQKAYKELYDDGGEYYKTVIIDSLTELQKLDMRTIMQEAYDSRPDTTDKDVPSPREWGKTGNHMRTIIRGFRDLPVNTIMTCLQGSQYDESSGMTLVYPELPGKMRHESPGYFDVVGYLRADTNSKGEITRILQTAKTRRVVAKDRTASLGDVLNEPTVPIMWDLIHGKTQPVANSETETKE